MASNTLRTILLKGQAQGKRREAVANAAITPGHLCEYMSTGNVRKHATAGGEAYPLFAAENEVFGGEIGTDYVAEERALLWHATQGDEINALVAAAAVAVVIGDRLESAGDGTLRKFTAQVEPNEDGLYDIATLAISATPDQFKTTTTAAYKLDAVQYEKAATDNLVFTANDTVNTAGAAGIKYGIWRVQINAAGVVSTKPGGGLADQVYTSAALALAALPAVDAGNVSLGYITVASPTLTAFIANTTALTTIGAFVDETVVAVNPASIVQAGAVASAMEAVDNSAGGAVARIRVMIL